MCVCENVSWGGVDRTHIVTLGCTPHLLLWGMRETHTHTHTLTHTHIQISSLYTRSNEEQTQMKSVQETLSQTVFLPVLRLY